MIVECTAGQIEERRAGCAVAVPVRQDAKGLPRWTAKLPDALREALTAALAGDSFAGKLGQTAIVWSRDGAGVLVGTGKTTDPESIRRTYGATVQAAVKAKLTSLIMPIAGGRDLNAAAENATIGAILGNYRFDTFRSDTSAQAPPLETLLLWEPDAKKRRSAQQGIASGRTIAEATCRVRDLVNTPANELYPESYAQIAQSWCKEAGVKLQVLGPREIERVGMGAVIAVGKGSERKPRFLVMTYLGRKRQPKKVDVCLVGKGVTFDTGGISLKPPTDMWEMRGDMMGSAVMLSTICAAAKLKLPVNIVTLTPLVENMPSAAAYRPGDVVKTLSGQTIEIISTDAEGRLILADALTYAQRFKPGVIIDCATLTGAVVVALGTAACAVFTDDDALYKRFEKAAAATGEKAWRMPLYEEYDKQFESDVADMKNSGGREGGASVAGRILKRFVGDYPWVHIDIAGVDNYKRGHHYCPRGASGFGARLMLDFLRRR